MRAEQLREAVELASFHPQMPRSAMRSAAWVCPLASHRPWITIKNRLSRLYPGSNPGGRSREDQQCLRANDTYRPADE